MDPNNTNDATPSPESNEPTSSGDPPPPTPPEPPAPEPPAPEPPPPPADMRASIYPLATPLDPEMVECIRIIEEECDLECWLFFTGYVGIEPIVYNAFFNHRASLPSEPIALIVDSSGGIGETAFRISRMLQRRCGGFTAIVPRMAKSAATLLSLGADRIILGEEADLGPLDAQFHDYDEEERQVSALDTVQAVEALEESAVKVGMKMLRYLQQNTGKRYSLLIEPSLRFAAEITKPLFEKIDAVRYTRQSRILREAQDYAQRLLRHRFTDEEAEVISRELVQNYPAHGFVIDFDEAKRVGKKEESVAGESVGLHVEKPKTKRMSEALDKLRQLITEDKVPLIFGKLVPLAKKGPSP